MTDEMDTESNTYIQPPALQVLSKTSTSITLKIADAVHKDKTQKPVYKLVRLRTPSSCVFYELQAEENDLIGVQWAWVSLLYMDWIGSSR